MVLVSAINGRAGCDAVLPVSSAQAQPGAVDEIQRGKPTTFIRDRVTVAAPHCISACPLPTAVKRICKVTGTHLTCKDATPAYCSGERIMLRHRSTV
jgi:hypothetical protein